MTSFLYTHNYDAPGIQISAKETSHRATNTLTRKPKKRPSLRTPSGDCNTVLHAKMYAVGSKYSIASLKEVSRLKFTQAATYAWNNDEFLHAIQIVHTTTPEEDEGLRDVVAGDSCACCGSPAKA
jgi:hypothetical protein